MQLELCRHQLSLLVVDVPARLLQEGLQQPAVHGLQRLARVRASVRGRDRRRSERGELLDERARGLVLGSPALQAHAVDDRVEQHRETVGLAVLREAVGERCERAAELLQRRSVLAASVEAQQRLRRDAVDLQVVRPALVLVEPDRVGRVQAVGGERFGEVAQRALQRSLQEQLPVQAVLQALQRLGLLQQPAPAGDQVAARREEVLAQQRGEQLQRALVRAFGLGERVAVPVHPVVDLLAVEHEADVVRGQRAAVAIDQREVRRDEHGVGVLLEGLAAALEALGMEQVVRVQQGDIRRVDGLEGREHGVAEAEVLLVDADLDPGVGDGARARDRLVRGAVVDHQELERPVGLAEHAAHRLIDVDLVLVGRDQHGHVGFTRRARELTWFDPERRGSIGLAVQAQLRRPWSAEAGHVEVGGEALVVGDPARAGLRRSVDALELGEGVGAALLFGDAV